MKNITPRDHKIIDLYWQGQHNQGVEVCRPTAKNNNNNYLNINEQVTQKAIKNRPNKQSKILLDLL